MRSQRFGQGSAECRQSAQGGRIGSEDADTGAARWHVALGQAEPAMEASKEGRSAQGNFRWTVVTGVSDVSGCSANQRKTTGAFRTSWVPNPSTVHPWASVLMTSGDVWRVFACASAYFNNGGERVAARNQRDSARHPNAAGVASIVNHPRHSCVGPARSEGIAHGPRWLECENPGARTYPAHAGVRTGRRARRWLVAVHVVGRKGTSRADRGAGRTIGPNRRYRRQLVALGGCARSRLTELPR